MISEENNEKLKTIKGTKYKNPPSRKKKSAFFVYFLPFASQ